MTRQPRFYFSFRSPYSWLAHHDLSKHYPGVMPDLDWRPFWEPDGQSERLLTDLGGRFIYTPMSKEKHLYVLRDVRRLVEQRGLAVTWPLDHKPCWELAHLAYFAAVDAGRGMAFIDRVYRARWQEGRNICDRETVSELAEEVGVSGVLAREAAEQDDMRRRGANALLAIERDGVFGVPFFIHRSHKFWGVDRLADFLHALRSDAGGAVKAAEEAGRLPMMLADDPRATDQGHAGGCG